MECTDFSAGLSTTAIATAGTSFASRFEVCDPLASGTTADTDWVRIDLVYGQTYLFVLTTDETHSGKSPTLRMADYRGNADDRYDRVGERFFQVTARYSGSHYLIASQGFNLLNTDYRIGSYLMYDDLRGTAPRIKLLAGFVNTDELSSASDTDSFDLFLPAGRTWQIHARGQSTGSGTLSDPFVNLTKNGVFIGQDFDSGVGTDARIFYTPLVDETIQVTVGGTGAGTYRVFAVAGDEAAGNHTTTSNLAFGAGTLAKKTAYVSFNMDSDWHRVSLKGSDVVKLTMRGTAATDFLRTPGARLINAQGVQLGSASVWNTTNDAIASFYVHIPTGGAYYAIAKTALENYVGEYEISLEKVRAPFEAKNLFGRGATTRLPIGNGTSIPLADLLDLKGLALHSYQVWSEVPLKRDGITMAARTNFGIIASEIGLWSIDTANTDEAQLYLRGYVGTTWSHWQKFPIVDTTPPPALLSASAWVGTGSIKYRMVSSLPAYYAPGEFGTISPISSTAGAGFVIQQVIDEFNASGLGRQLIAAATGEEADINIFIGSDVPQPLLSYLPGAGRGGDIILRASNFGGPFDDLSDFLIARALGNALGLNFVSGVSHLDSIMGDQAYAGGGLPTSLGVDDVKALQQLYGSTIYDPTDTFAGLTQVTLTSTAQIITITNEAKRIAASPSLIADVIIDLRDGQRSGMKLNGVFGTEVFIAPGAAVEQATGGSGNDEIYGNGRDNVLRGGEGNNFLFGYGGNDRFFGGSQTDTFIHYFGDGRDIIVDDGGTDTLCFFGIGDFRVDDLDTDYTFRRTGNYMDINLTLDGGLGEGFVRIDTRANQTGLVESLELWHENALSSRISLASIWNQLANGQERRFQLAGGSDSFGLLTSPV